MKKIFNVLLSVCLLFSCFIIPENASARTLQDAVDELNVIKKEYQSNKDKEKLTNEQIAQIKTNMSNIESKITQINKDIQRLNDEIHKLGMEIDNKDKEIKQIINFLQLSNGESAYLEYAFGAQDFTDFIYRVAITEQLTDYNDKLIDEYNKMIDDNNKKSVQLKSNEEELKMEQKNLAAQAKKLGEELKGYYDISIDLAYAIRVQEEYIQVRRDRGCKLTDDVDNCGNKIPRDNTFWRPLVTAAVSSWFGPRTYWLNGREVKDKHTGVDMAANVGTNIYAAAKGVVGPIIYRYSCGGNIVTIHHDINGQNFSTQYMHMYNVYVKEDDVVTKDTIIGTVGGAEWATPWDGCSSGSHLHFGLMYGHIGNDYSYWSYPDYIINPVNKVNIPYYWTDRNTYY